MLFSVEPLFRRWLLPRATALVAGYGTWRVTAQDNRAPDGVISSSSPLLCLARAKGGRRGAATGLWRFWVPSKACDRYLRAHGVALGGSQKFPGSALYKPTVR